MAIPFWTGYFIELIMFCSNGDETVPIVTQNSGDDYAMVQKLGTQKRAKTVALERKTHNIYLSGPEFKKTKNSIPGSFKVLAYWRQVQ